MHPDESVYTFWDYFRNAYARNAGLRIDHLLLTPDLAKRLKAASVDRDVRGWEKTSDHLDRTLRFKAIQGEVCKDSAAIAAGTGRRSSCGTVVVIEVHFSRASQDRAGPHSGG
jgi:hypothetical protein